MEAVRQAELVASARKRNERKLAAAGTPTPVLDPSARLKTLPRLFNSATPTTSRSVFIACQTVLPAFLHIVDLCFFVDQEHQVVHLNLF
jgi:RNA polymerase-associated protein RTF1